MRCKSCKEKFEPKYFNQKYCMVKDECIKAFTDSLKTEKKKQDDRKWRQCKKETKEKLKTLSDWKNDLQSVINWIAREIDKDRPCIAHPDIKDFLRYDAGHYYTVKAHSDIRFNLHNIHKQSSESNERYGGNADYANGLKARYGMEYLEYVLSLPQRFKGTAKEKYTISNIRNIYLPNARKIQREMKEGQEFTRDEVNELVGIY